jgi:peptidoglycan/LPS O-acetylase OafA/YrhL
MKRIFGLDLLRTLAMASVIMSHEGHDRIFGVKYGIIGVEFFFVMSGFLIGEMLIRDFRDGFSFSDLKTFWVKRWFRTIPLYYAVLILKFTFIDHSPGLNIFYYFSFLQNNFYGISFLGVSWTLVLEEWFYLLMPVLFFIFFRNGIKPRSFYLFVAGFAILSLAARFFYAVYLDRPFTAVNGNFPFRFDSFLIGVCLAAIKIFHDNIYRSMARWKFFLFVMAGFSVLIYFFRQSYGITFEGQQSVWMRTTWFTLVSLVLTMFLPFLCEQPFLKNLSYTNPVVFLITWASLLSYPAYLIHMDIFKLVDKVIPGIYAWNEALGLSLKIGVVIVFSLVLYYFIHEPFIRLRSIVIKKLAVV